MNALYQLLLEKTHTQNTIDLKVALGIKQEDSFYFLLYRVLRYQEEFCTKKEIYEVVKKLRPDIKRVSLNTNIGFLNCQHWWFDVRYQKFNHKTRLYKLEKKCFHPTNGQLMSELVKKGY